MLEGLPPPPPLVPNSELIRVVVAVIYAPRWDLDPAPLAFGEGGWVLIQYTQVIPPMFTVEVGSRGHLKYGKTPGNLGRGVGTGRFPLEI